MKALEKLRADYVLLTFPRAQELQNTIPAQAALLEDALSRFDGERPRGSETINLEVALAHAILGKEEER